MLSYDVYVAQEIECVQEKLAMLTCQSNVLVSLQPGDRLLVERGVYDHTETLVEVVWLTHCHIQLYTQL